MLERYCRQARGWPVGIEQSYGRGYPINAARMDVKAICHEKPQQLYLEAFVFNGVTTVLKREWRTRQDSNLDLGFEASALSTELRCPVPFWIL